MNITHDSQKDGMIDMITRARDVLASNWNNKDDVHDDDDDDIYFMQDGNLRIYASPWSPPAWMKQPMEGDDPNATHAVNMTGSTEPSCLREGTGPDSKYAKAWALYFSKFITACKYDTLFWMIHLVFLLLFFLFIIIFLKITNTE